MSQPSRRLHIDLTLAPSVERTYLRIPFELLPGTSRLTLRYAFPRHREDVSDPTRTFRREVNIVDFALEDADHVLVGASGSDRSEIVVHENYATDGYRPASLVPGTWYVLLGAYLVEPDGCPVMLDIEQEARHPVLLKGDTHVHTNHSDGWYSVEEVTARARQDRLDYVFITDHNSMTSNARLVSDESLLVLPGVELTYYDGHCNLLGVARPVRTFFANGRDEVLDRVREGRANGALASINHPFYGGCEWKFGLDPSVEVDLLEVWNGPFTMHNIQALGFWQQQLSAGRRMPVIGGSDNHRNDQFLLMGNPTTFAYAESRCGSDLLAALRSGHSFIGSTPDAPEIDLTAGNARMGDTLKKGDADSVVLKASRLRPQDEIRFITEAGVVHRQRIEQEVAVRVELPLPDARFLRVEVWRPIPGLMETLSVLGNPIYFG